MKATVYRLGKRVLVSLLCLAATLLVCEIVLRVVDYRYNPFSVQVASETGDWRGFHAFCDAGSVYDPHLLWRPNPACPMFNAEGFVTPGPPLGKKKGGEYRIFVFGDSNSAGWWDDGLGRLRAAAWPARLGELLAQRSEDFKVVNASMWGYSSYQGLARFRECLAFEPDMVLISFGANDAHRVSVGDSDYTPWLFKTPLRRSRLGELLIAAWHRPAAGSDRTRPQHAVARVSVSQYRANLERIIGLCRRHDIRCVLLTRPFIGESHDELWWKSFAPQYIAATRQVGRELGVPVIDIHEQFKNRQELFRDDCHFTKEGHRLAAKIILDEIEPLLPH